MFAGEGGGRRCRRKVLKTGDYGFGWHMIRTFDFLVFPHICAKTRKGRHPWRIDRFNIRTRGRSPVR